MQLELTQRKPKGLLYFFITICLLISAPAFSEQIPSSDTSGALHSSIEENQKNEELDDFLFADDDAEGSAQFMVEAIPHLPAPQLIKPQTPQLIQPTTKIDPLPASEEPTRITEDATTQIYSEDLEEPVQEKKKKKGLFGWFTKDEDVEEATKAPVESKALQPIVTQSQKSSAQDLTAGSAQFAPEPSQLPMHPLATGSIAPTSPQVKPIDQMQKAPKADTSIPTQPVASTIAAQPVLPQTPSPVVDPIVTPVAPQPITTPSFKVVPIETKEKEQSLEEEALAAPSTPTPTQEELKSLDQIIADLPQRQGIYMVSPLESDMWEAARNLEFEKAIDLRNQINALKENDSVAQIITLEKLMTQAAEQLDFEKAIEYREQIRELQQRIEVPIEEPKAPEVVFQIQGIQITGNELVDSASLMAYAESLVNRDITLSDVRAVASDIKKHYRELGYIAAYVFIPPQTLDEGVLEIAVIEGELGQIKVRGNEYFSSQVLLSQFHVEPGQAILYNTIKNQLSKINDHRDIQIKATFEPGEAPQTTDLVLDVEDQRPIHVSLDYNNYGTELTGEERYGGTFTHSNVFGNMDEFYLRLQGSEGSQAIALDYNTPFIHPEFRLGGAFTIGSSDLTGDFKALNAQGQATTYSIYGKFPLYYDGSLDVSLRGGFDYKSFENELLGITTGRDEVRTLNTVINIEQTDQWGKTYWPQAFFAGIDAFGASNKNDESLMRAQTGAPFLIYRSEIDRFIYLPADMMLHLNGAWQLTPDKLPSSEQFSIGGFNTVRGYPQGEYLGDYGAVMTAELSTPIFGLPSNLRLPYQKEPLYDNLRFVGFYDYGTANLKGALPGEASKVDISGAGMGLRLRLYDRINGQIEYAMPLGDEPSNASSGSWYYGVSMDVI